MCYNSIIEKNNGKLNRLLALSETVVLFFFRKKGAGVCPLLQVEMDFKPSLLKFLAERSDTFGIWLILPKKKACFKTNKST